MSLTSYRAAPPRVNFSAGLGPVAVVCSAATCVPAGGLATPRDIFLHGADTGLKRVSEPA